MHWPPAARYARCRLRMPIRGRCPILPLLTSAHLPSASNHDLWYELPTNMPVVEGSGPSPYGDRPISKIFGIVSPLDTQMFSTVAEYAQSLIHHNASAKYSPIDIARWVAKCIDNPEHWLNAAARMTKARGGSAFWRIEEDVLIQIGLGPSSRINYQRCSL